MTAAADPFAAYRPIVLAELRRIIDASAYSHAALLREQLATLAAAEAPSSGPPDLLPSCLCLLAAEALGGSPDAALPAAAALALLSSMGRVFSEIASERDGPRAASRLEAAWGLPRALNAGDGFFALAQSALLDAAGADADRTLQAVDLLETASRSYSDDLNATLDAPSARGQRDRRPSPTLLSAGASLGALYAGADGDVVDALGRFGRSMAMAAPDVTLLDRVSLPSSARKRLLEAAKYIEEVGP